MSSSPPSLTFTSSPPQDYATTRKTVRATMSDPEAIAPSPQPLLPPTPPSEPSTTLSTMPSPRSIISPVSAASPRPPPTTSKHIWVITGPAGCGKTSVAEFLHATFALPYLEGDLFHTPENVEKMASGRPLNDADRWDWLVTLREEAVKALLGSPSSSSLSSTSSDGVIVTCSALKRKYRDVLRIAAYHRPEIQLHFVFLRTTEALLMDRVRARKNHYMKDHMVRSQFESLETPSSDERDVLEVDASGTSQQVQELALRAVEREMAGDADRAPRSRARSQQKS